MGVWTLDADGKGEKRRVADFGGVTSWSPDGKQLIVAKWLSKPQDDDMRHETWRFNADGSGATKLPIPETDEVDDWSPDGQLARDGLRPPPAARQRLPALSHASRRHRPAPADRGRGPECLSPLLARQPADRLPAPGARQK